MTIPVSISCVIPTHGRPEFLSAALASVLAQETAAHEVIVVSDDNLAESRAVVQSFADRSAVPIRYVDNSAGSGGASSSRNAGASTATGSHLAFLDDDDLWQPGYLASAARLLEASTADCVVTWLMMFRDALKVPGLTMRPGLSAHDVAAINPGFTGSNFVCTSESFHAIGGFDDQLPVINDGDFVYRYLQAGFAYAVVEEFGVLQRKHAEGQLTAATEMRARGLEQYMAKHRSTLTLRDRRYMRLAIHRIRYHCADSRIAKFRYLAAGAVNSSRRSIMLSVRGWRQRPLWRA